MNIIKYLMPLSIIQEIELPKRGGFANKLPWFQNNLGACAAMAAARALSLVFGFPVSALWIFINAKIQEDSFDVEGLGFPSIIYVICALGVIPESMLDYSDKIEWWNKEKLQSMITDEMKEKAIQYRIKGVVPLENSRQIKQSLANKFPVIWGTAMSKEFRFDEDGFVLLSGIIAGAHAMHLPNYDEEMFYKFKEFSEIDKSFVNIDQTWKIDNRPWGDDNIGHISERALDDEIIVMEGEPGFKMWKDCYALIPFESERRQMIKPKRTVELRINELNYKADGVCKISDAAPYIKNSRTMVPIRILSEGLGFGIEWLEETREILISDEFGTIKLKAGSKEIYFHSAVQELEWIKSETELEVPVEIVNGRSFVPIRFVGEKMSCEIEWDGYERKVTAKYY